PKIKVGSRSCRERLSAGCGACLLAVLFLLLLRLLAVRAGSEYHRVATALYLLFVFLPVLHQADGVEPLPHSLSRCLSTFSSVVVRSRRRQRCSLRARPRRPHPLLG